MNLFLMSKNDLKIQLIFQFSQKLFGFCHQRKEQKTSVLFCFSQGKTHGKEKGNASVKQKKLKKFLKIFLEKKEKKREKIKRRKSQKVICVKQCVVEISK